jgi:two-component system LytT family sensor kinase
LKGKRYINLVVVLVLLAYAIDLSAQSAGSALKKVDKANKEVISNPESAFVTATEALSLSIKSKDKKAEASSYNTLGTLYYNSGNYKKAIEYFLKAKSIYETVEDIKSKEYTLKYLAKSYEALGLNSKSIKYNKMAEETSSSKNAKFGYRYKNSQLKQSIGKNKEAIDDLENELLDTTTIPPSQKIDIYLELGNLYIVEKDTAKGLDLIQRALIESNTKDNVLLDDSIRINTLNKASNIYNARGFGDLNIQTQKNALSEAEGVDNEPVLNAANYNIGMTYIESDPKTAVQFFSNSAAITEGDPEKKWEHINAVEKLSEAYAKSGDYVNAFETYKKYIVLVDSIKEAEISNKLNNELLTEKFEIQETKLAALELEQKERKKELQEKQFTIFGLVAGISLLFLLSFFLFKNIRQKQKSNMMIQLASLRSQMNPHFIFNSLNSVNGFVSRKEEVKANRFISEFSKLMRTVLNNSDKESISLEEELASLRIYLSLEHSRFEDKFDYEILVDPDIDIGEIHVPPMLIQPYLENAIWHGLRYKENKGFLKLELKQGVEDITIVVEDNGIGREKSQALKTNHQKDSKSTGIKNTKERMKLLNKLYKTTMKVEIIDLMEKGMSAGTKVLVSIPKTKAFNNV